jgi:superfamily II DNA/RNA helicase
VCTTVLEEGIDVSDCDLVIRYSGVNTLIQFIQSRGRARRQGSRYVIIVTADEHAKAVTLASQERLMDHALTEHATAHGLPGDWTRELMARARDEGAEFASFHRPRSNSAYDSMVLFDAASDGAAIVEFYLQHSQNLDLEKAYDYIKGLVYKHVFFYKNEIIIAKKMCV